MNYQSCSTVGEQGVVANAQRYTWILQRVLRSAVSLDSEVRHITRMRSLRILQSVVLLARIEMWTSRGERWSLTLGELVNMCGMLAGRQVLEVERNRNTACALANANEASPQTDEMYSPACSSGLL
jgi:hypothetical protein